MIKYFLPFLFITPAFAGDWYSSSFPSDFFDTPELAASFNYKNLKNPNLHHCEKVSDTRYTCFYVSSNTQGYSGGLPIYKRASSCVANATFVKSGTYVIQNWRGDQEYQDLNAQAFNFFSGSTICASSCIHSFDFLTDKEGTTSKLVDDGTGHVTFTGRFTSTTTSCSSNTSAGSGTSTGSGPGGETGGGESGGGETGGGETGGGNTGGGLSNDGVDRIVNSQNSNTDRIVNKIDSAQQRLGEIFSDIGSVIQRDLAAIRDMLSSTSGDGEVDTGGFGDGVPPSKEITQKDFDKNIFQSNAQCPADRTLVLPLFASRSFTHTFSFTQWCSYLGIFGTIFLIFSYCFAAYIVVSKS